ncbi:hypothetical protein CD790_11260 [Streptomyces sp. SAJ15]|nr:hypothetical protein CD790_11260 [Streptomyces sp. SAJ15]
MVLVVVAERGSSSASAWWSGCRLPGVSLARPGRLLGVRAEWAGGGASGAVDRSGRRPRAASARGPRKRAALIQ